MAEGLTMEYLEQFLTSQEEKIVVAVRKHQVVLLAPFLFSSFLFTVGIILSIASYWTFNSFSIVLLSLLVVISLSSYIISKALIDWYSHLYIVTTHKILEVCFVPPLSHTVNDVLLEQVRCTEVDVRTEGLINQVLDVGSATITFDRPTHEEEFTFLDIKSPHQFGLILANSLGVASHDGKQAWFKQKNKKGLRFTEERGPDRDEQRATPYTFA